MEQMRLPGRQRVLSEWEQGGYELRLVGVKSGLDNQIDRAEVFLWGAWWPVEAALEAEA